MSKTTTNRSVRFEPTDMACDGVMVVTRGVACDKYVTTEVVGCSPRRFLVTRIDRTGDLHTASGKQAASRHDTYTCHPQSRVCNCARGSYLVNRGVDSDCVHVLALSKLLQIGALPDPMERPGQDVSNTEIHEQEPVGTMYDPMDEYADEVELAEFIAL